MESYLGIERILFLLFGPGEEQFEYEGCETVPLAGEGDTHRPGDGDADLFIGEDGRGTRDS